MPDTRRLEDLLRRVDGRPYPAYKALEGRWRVAGGTLEILVDHVQGDPFARPSRMRLRVPTGIGADLAGDPDAREAAEDWLLRRFGRDLRGRRRGSGRSGELRVYRPGPEITARSALRLEADGTAEVRFEAGLPAAGRRILGREARDLLLRDLPEAAERLRGVGGDPGLAAHVRSVRVQRALRRQLPERRLVAFVADGAVLPRASGVSQAPLAGAVPFRAPPALRVVLDTPEGPVAGMGIPEGVTVIVGGGYHGKSTLLRAIQRGHLDHVPGDGRERVVTRPDAVKIRAEDGRRVAAVDIHPFLRELPGGRPTRPFSTDDASGSSSQAAAVMEAIEVGAGVLLMDEDTSATNLMVRDARMRRLVPREPITPLVERVRALHAEWGVSTVVVVGGVGDWLGVADVVIGMEDWLPRDLTEAARALGIPRVEAADPLEPPAPRRPVPGSLRPRGKGRVTARDERRIDHGTTEIDLRAVEQVLDGAHAASIGHAVRLLGELLADRPLPLARALDALEAVLADEGVEALSPFPEPVGDLVRPRRFEVAAAVNRLRTLEIA